MLLETYNKRHCESMRRHKPVHLSLNFVRDSAAPVAAAQMRHLCASGSRRRGRGRRRYTQRCCRGLFGAASEDERLNRNVSINIIITAGPRY